VEATGKPTTEVRETRLNRPRTNPGEAVAKEVAADAEIAKETKKSTAASSSVSQPLAYPSSTT